MKKISLTQGKVALVDEIDLGHLMEFKWHSVYRNGHWYAARRIKTSSGRKQIFMHRVIMNLMCPGFRGLIDHKDRNGLNDKRLNLRIATYSQNGANRKPNTNSFSKYKGVSWNRRDGKWQAHIRYQGVTSNLGYFDCEIKAAKAYDIAAIRLFGEFAKLNFPKENYPNVYPYKLTGQLI